MLGFWVNHASCQGSISGLKIKQHSTKSCGLSFSSTVQVGWCEWSGQINTAIPTNICHCKVPLTSQWTISPQADAKLPLDSLPVQKLSHSSTAEAVSFTEWRDCQQPTNTWQVTSWNAEWTGNHSDGRRRLVQQRLLIGQPDLILSISHAGRKPASGPGDKGTCWTSCLSGGAAHHLLCVEPTACSSRGNLPLTSPSWLVKSRRANPFWLAADSATLPKTQLPFLGIWEPTGSSKRSLADTFKISQLVLPNQSGCFNSLTVKLKTFLLAP